MAAGVVLLILFTPVPYLKGVVVLLSLIACWEFLTIAVAKKKAVRLLGIFCTLSGGLLLAYMPEFRYLLMFIYGVIFSAFVIQYIGNLETGERIRQSAFFVLAVFYSVFLFGLLNLITDRPHYRFLLFLVIACTYMADTGAYIIGRKFGKHKLARVLSPGKTIEGAGGSIMGGMLAALLVRYVFLPEINLFVVLCLGVFIAILGILGDLAESLLKRGFGVKDSGTIIPGHGGILDRLDSLLFTAPFVYFVSFYIFT